MQDLDILVRIVDLQYILLYPTVHMFTVLPWVLIFLLQSQSSFSLACLAVATTLGSFLPRWIVEGAKTAMLFDGCGSHLYMVHGAVWLFFQINRVFFAKEWVLIYSIAGTPCCWTDWRHLWPVQEKNLFHPWHHRQGGKMAAWPSQSWDQNHPGHFAFSSGWKMLYSCSPSTETRIPYAETP